MRVKRDLLNWFEFCLGIILKKARMIKKGKLEANVAHGGMVETLVILTGDLVQVVAKACSHFNAFFFSGP